MQFGSTRSRLVFLGFTLSLCGVLASGACAQDDEAKMMQAWQKAGTPGEHHKQLEQLCGTWDVTVSSWMDPAGPPLESKGTAVAKMIFGGRYLQEDFHSTFMGMPFKGMGLTGYDNMTQQFAGVWIDDMSTGVMTIHGTWDAEKSQVVMSGSYVEPVSGQETTMRMVTTFVDDDKHTVDFYNTGPDGKEFKSMVMVYERAK